MQKHPLKSKCAYEKRVFAYDLTSSWSSSWSSAAAASSSSSGLGYDAYYTTTQPNQKRNYIQEITEHTKHNKKVEKEKK